MLSQTVIQWIAVGAGALVVPISSLLKNPTWAPKVKFALSVLVSVLATLGVAIPVELSDVANVNFATTGAVVFAVSQLLYKLGLAKTPFETTLANSLVKPRQYE